MVYQTGTIISTNNVHHIRQGIYATLSGGAMDGRDLWDQVTHGQAPHWCIHPRHREEWNSVRKTADRWSWGLSCKNIISLLFLFIKESSQWMLHHITAESLTFTCDINTKATNQLHRTVMPSKVRRLSCVKHRITWWRAFGKHFKVRWNTKYTDKVIRRSIWNNGTAHKKCASDKNVRSAKESWILKVLTFMSGT